ncbi:hypothetical protein CONCODRAFT_10889 [Conidiobolus coronatus NRRL 28638]|uniref:RNI-like protein n=1 Tax=Conidiobolus coronatus (strain ATCC 28846 / CBS 209.66 / NRRL 28638) TaxID=796925 RepID=A0A137NWB6_CONC2|nr:hypothetical protein CONCODRAFT_10889 [Conidiobolus coronatus NRRL 28638]|eukprot:KXN67120.1 hypothetical protein CONCODRAFT_10889 [Conidiobolus coronatus NRRL 28638]
MESLEHVYFSSINDEVDEYISTNPIFPKSIKSLKICYINESNVIDDDLLVYNTIDASYINLNSLTIITNKMLENLSSGMTNLQEIEIKNIYNLDNAKLVDFLKFNPQLRKLDTDNINYNEEILKVILSSKYLEHWSINSGSWEHVEINNLPSNCSIKYLRINSSMPDSLILHLINFCKSLKTLELEINRDFNYLGWSKLERRVNKLKLVYNRQTLNGIKEIDALGLFNSVHVEIDPYTKDDINKHIDFKLNNYKVIFSTSKTYSLKLIN